MRSNMLRLRWESLNPSWSEFITKLFRDLEPLGHTLSHDDSGVFTGEICEPSTIADDHFWDEAHRVCHQKELEEHREDILGFERDFGRFFVDIATFQPSAVRPVLEIIDFKRDEHKKIVEYLRLTQSVTSRKLVGKRMGFSRVPGSPNRFVISVSAGRETIRRPVANMTPKRGPAVWTA
jgi:hypothetical protein